MKPKDFVSHRKGHSDSDASAQRVLEPWESGPPPGFCDDDAPIFEPPPEQSREQSKDADKVVAAVLNLADLFHDPKHNAFANVRIGDRRVVFRLRSNPSKIWIAKTAREVTGKSIGLAAVDEALLTLEGIARYDRPMRRVSVRVAHHEDGICLDLGDDTGACIVVTADGWTVVDDPPAMFRRPDAMRPLPRPVRGGSVDELRPFVNLTGDSFLLFVAWLVAALRPDRPFSILSLHGEQGTAKSTATRVARALVDPNFAPLRSVPRKEDDLAIAALHSHVVAFDNLSGLQPAVSDALCRLATGGGLSKRTLYSDDDETVLDAVRPVIVNGIEDLANRADLAERSLLLTLQPLPKGRRRDEESFWRDFANASPRILGALLDGVVAALRCLPSLHIAELPRMADFAKWIAAAEVGLGFSEGTMLAAYARNRASVVDAALNASPIATAVRALIEERGAWEGTPTELLHELSTAVSQGTRRDPSWPSNPRALAQSLTRNATILRSIGIEMDLSAHAGRGADKRRIYRLSRSGASAEIVPTVPASPKGDFVDDSRGRNADRALSRNDPGILIGAPLREVGTQELEHRPRQFPAKTRVGDAGSMGTILPDSPQTGESTDSKGACK